MAAVLLKGGKYGEPTGKQRSEMASTLPVNRPSESGFGMYDYYLRSGQRTLVLIRHLLAVG